MGASSYTIGNEDEGIRLDRWFRRHYPGLSHAMLEKQLRKGMVRLDGKKAQSSDRVQAGQVVLCPGMPEDAGMRPKRRASEEQCAAIQSWVIYKDANLIIINKPFGLAVQGGSKVNNSVDDMLDGLMFETGERPKLVHRLDRDTSGVLVLARNAKSAAQLAKLFAGKTLQKTYLALVHGVPQPLKGIVNLPLLKVVKGEYAREQMGVDEEEGKIAITQYRVMDALARRFALMELKPLTGRMHQLRVHMAEIGCPIVGDHKYGGGLDAAEEKNMGALEVENILHLHARRIVIPAFGGSKAVDVSAPLPEHMQKSFRALGLDVPKR